MLASLRIRRLAFWHLAPDRIVAAVVSRTDREPLLEACAASYAPPVDGACFAPGVLEVSWVLGCRGEAHVAALGEAFCRLEAVEAAPGAAPGRGPVRRRTAAARRDADDGIVVSAVRGDDAHVVTAERRAVDEAASLFRRARLSLLALDCEGCALATLADVLGARDAETARRQHLAAVAVAPEAEKTVEALGDDLAVPVALAVGWFGAGRAH